MSAKRNTFTDRDAALSAEDAPMELPKTLGPGDDDGSNADRGQAGEARPPLGPGDADPNDKVNRNVRMLAQPPAGPGEVHTPRRITVFPVETKE